MDTSRISTGETICVLSLSTCFLSLLLKGYRYISWNVYKGSTLIQRAGDWFWIDLDAGLDLTFFFQWCLSEPFHPVIKHSVVGASLKVEPSVSNSCLSVHIEDKSCVFLGSHRELILLQCLRCQTTAWWTLWNQIYSERGRNSATGSSTQLWTASVPTPRCMTWSWWRDELTFSMKHSPDVYK